MKKKIFFKSVSDWKNVESEILKWISLAIVSTSFLVSLSVALQQAENTKVIGNHTIDWEYRNESGVKPLD